MMSSRAAGPLLLLLAATSWLGVAGAARADLVSPGELSRAHQKLEGVQNCTKCHAAGQRLSAEKCLECHKEMRGRVAQGKGFHGRLADKACETCHHEHQGRGFPLVDWGDAGQKGFDHAKTGYPLQGKHQKVKCEDCHGPHGSSAVLPPHERNRLSGYSRSIWGPSPARISLEPWQGKKMTDCSGCHAHRDVAESCLGCHK